MIIHPTFPSSCLALPLTCKARNTQGRHLHIPRALETRTPPYVVGEAVKSETMHHQHQPLPVEAVPIQVQVYVQGPQAIAYGWTHESRHVQCHRCRAQVMTQVSHDFGAFACSFCVVGCICFGVCGLWPLCCFQMQDTDHICPSCGVQLAHVPGRLV